MSLVCVGPSSRAHKSLAWVLKESKVYFSGCVAVQELKSKYQNSETILSALYCTIFTYPLPGPPTYVKSWPEACKRSPKGNDLYIL